MPPVYCNRERRILMYILKNALRNITRAKGRNILIGCIAFVIGLSACLALSIREAADRERESGLSDLNITATIHDGGCA